MSRFMFRKLPPNWLFVPSKRQVRDLLVCLEADVRLVEFSGTSAVRAEGRLSLGYVESRVVDGGWRFYLRLWGARSSEVGEWRQRLSQAALGEIERYIRACLGERPTDVTKPVQLYLSFRIDAGDIRSQCRAKVVDRYSFSAGEWWRDEVPEGEKGTRKESPANPSR